jgi:hypothetical protein
MIVLGFVDDGKAFEENIAISIVMVHFDLAIGEDVNLCDNK